MPKHTRPEDPIRLVVVDDHPIVREGLVAVLGREPDFRVVGVGANAADAFDLAERHLPHVMLLDVNMPGGGLSALARIAAAYPAVAVIILTVREDPETVGAAMKTGARGYLLKGVGGKQLTEIVRTIRRGEHYVSPALAARLLMETAATDAASGGHSQASNAGAVPVGLTVREEQILRLLAGGASNKQIAGELALSESTVKHYMTNLMQKLQVKNRVEAALLAQRQRNSE
jgi:two-component system, NarL family, nitrate/nitrite response regulator NarL